jgi:hypothetical protein
MQATYKPMFERFVDNMVYDMPAGQCIEMGPFVASVDLGVNGHGIMLVGVTDLDNRYHVLYEFEDEGRGLVGLLDRQSDLHWLKPFTIHVGCDGINSDVLRGNTAVELIEERGLGARVCRMGPRAGLQRIRSLITDDPGKCDLTIEPRCSRLIADLRVYACKQGGGEGWETVTPDASHSVDALRYLLEPVVSPVVG